MQNKTNTILLIVIIILLAVGIWFLAKKDSSTQIPDQNTGLSVTGPNASDLVSFSVKPGDTVSGKVKATGVVSGGYFFEANIVVNILDASKKLLRAGNGMSTADWMNVGPVSFSTDLDFMGLPAGSAYIEIKNDNPSDDRGYDKQILIPIVIK